MNEILSKLLLLSNYFAINISNEKYKELELQSFFLSLMLCVCVYVCSFIKLDQKKINSHRFIALKFQPIQICRILLKPK